MIRNILILALSIALIWVTIEMNTKSANIESLKSEANNQEKRKEEIKTCYANAYFNYSQTWDATCGSKGKDCTLPLPQSEHLDLMLSEEKDRCVQIYN